MTCLSRKEYINKKRIEWIGSGNPRWMGNKVGYRAIHTWINKYYGKANECINKKCLGISNKFEWANISGKYIRDRSDWMKLCKSCHMNFDNKNYCKNGHRRTIDNTRIRSNGWRECKLCIEKCRDRRNKCQKK